MRHFPRPRVVVVGNGITEKRAKRGAENDVDSSVDERAVEEAPQSMPDRLLDMQRRAGNNAVNAFVQTKLLVGPADDTYEREADAFASQAVGHDSAESGHGSAGGGDAGFAASGELASYVNAGGGHPLPTTVRRKLEPSFGLDFSDVRVHADGKAASMADSIGARAFTHGNDVYFGRGAYQPGSAGGEHLLAHELTHVVQQTGSAQRKIARKFDGSKVPSRLAQRRIQGNFLKTAKAVKSKAKDLFGKSKKEKRTTTGNAFLDDKSKPELQDYMAKTKGGGPSENPDWSNPKFFGESPTKFVVKLAVSQDDADWLKNMKAFRNAGVQSMFSSKGRKALGQAMNQESKDTTPKEGEEEKVDAKSYFARKALQGQGALDALSDTEIKEKIKTFTSGLSNVGHTWVRLESYVGGEIKDLYSYGMYPAKIATLQDRTNNYGGFSGMTSLGQGEIRHPDNVHEGDPITAYYSHDAKKPQFDKALALAGDLYKSPPPYLLAGYNCTAFAREIFQAAGGSYPAKGTLLPGFAYTPGNLYTAIATKAEEDEEKKAKGKKTSGKYSKTDDQKDLLKKVKQKQGLLAESGHRDAQSEFLSVPPDGAKETRTTFYARRTFKYGTRPDFPLDHSLTLDATREMVQVENDPALKNFGVETYWMGPKQYWFIAPDQADEARKPRKQPPLPAKKKGPEKLRTYRGSGMNPPSDDSDPVDELDVTKLDRWIERKRAGNWVRIFNTQDQETTWVKAGTWSLYYKPPESIHEDDKDGDNDAPPPPVLVFAPFGLGTHPKPGDKPIGQISGEELEDCRLDDTDEGWVELFDRTTSKKFWAREDAYKYALDPRRNPKPGPLPEPEKEEVLQEDANLLLDLGDDTTGLTFILDEAPELSDEFAVTKDHIAVYNNAGDDTPVRMVTTQEIKDMMADFIDYQPGWKSLALGIDYFSVKESDYEKWLELTGQKDPSDDNDDDEKVEEGPSATADEIPVYDNAGDPVAARLVTTQEIDDYMIDFDPYQDGWLSINYLGRYYSVREADHEKWLQLSGRK
ncbi:MAG: hypothetical protein QOG30_136 [Acidimicrobiaceae bacterium]